jgi:hypothetical protein
MGKNKAVNGASYLGWFIGCPNIDGTGGLRWDDFAKRRNKRIMSLLCFLYGGQQEEQARV